MSSINRGDSCLPVRCLFQVRRRRKYPQSTIVRRYVSHGRCTVQKCNTTATFNVMYLCTCTVDVDEYPSLFTVQYSTVSKVEI